MNFNELKKCKLFKGIESNEIERVLRCLEHRTKTYEKLETIWRIGDTVEEVGVVISGGVFIENVDFMGNRTILNLMQKNSVFGESYAVTGEKLMISAKASQQSEILFLNTKSITRTCSASCSFHSQLIDNLLLITSQHNIKLNQKIITTSFKSIRERVINYLSYEFYRNKSSDFYIPLSRQGLADYLNVDRSALSAELSRMKREGKIDFKKNYFVLYDLLDE